jgi:hypothetical protein
LWLCSALGIPIGGTRPLSAPRGFLYTWVYAGAPVITSLKKTGGLCDPGCYEEAATRVGQTTRHPEMNNPIISQSEAMQILTKDLRKLAIEKHAAELNNATPEKKAELMSHIDRDIQKELKRRTRNINLGILWH